MTPTPPQASGGDQAAETQKMALVPLNSSLLAGDLSGGFLGQSHENMLLGLPDATAGKTKLLQATVTTGQDLLWQTTNVQAPMWAATAAWGQTLIYAGGMTKDGLSREVGRLEIQNGTLTDFLLPPLPQPVAGAGAAVIKSKLYLFGGISSLSPFTLSNSLWSLDLNQANASWQQEAVLPGPGRAFSSVTGQYDTLCVVGGMILPQVAGTFSNISSETWVFRPRPWEGTDFSGWLRFKDAPEPILGAAIFPLGQAGIVISGGLDTTPESPWPKKPLTPKAQAPLLYNVVTDAWCYFDHPLGFSSLLATAEPTSFETRYFVLGAKDEKENLQLTELKIVRTAKSLTWLDYLIIFFYFAFISLIGVIASGKQKSSADFSLAGRNVPWWVAGISMFATGASAISFMAIPALAFASSLVFLFPLIIMAAPNYYVQSRLIYPLLRRMEITSTYEYLERRFNVALRLIASLQCIILQTFGRASVVLVLPSLAISATTGMNVYFSVILMWFITTIYTVLGGFQAVVWTDVFQGLLKLSAPILMILICIFSLPGGFHQFTQISQEHHKFDFALITMDGTVAAFWILLSNVFLASTIQTAGDQPVIQRVFSAPEKDVRRVSAMFVVCSLLIATVVNVLGISIYAYFHAHPARLDPLIQNDKVVPLFVIQALPHGIVGMIIAAIFASAMTTVASSMNSSATVFTEDFFMRFRPQANDKTRIFVLRLASIIVGLIALSIALLLVTLNLKSLMVTWSIINALLGGGIVGVYSLGMFTKKANGFGAVVGATLSIVLTAWVEFETPLHWQTLTPIAILSCIILGYLFSLFYPQKKNLRGLTIYKEQ